MTESSEGDSSTLPLDPYREVRDPAWEKEVAALGWRLDEEFSGLVLSGKCPACQHDDAINVFITTVGTALFTFSRPGQPPREFVACQCRYKHPGAPNTPTSGCGRWGYVAVKVSSPGADGTEAGGGRA